MKRREAIRRTTVLLGGTLSASAISAVMSGCKGAPIDTGWTPSHLTKDQINLVAEVAERILPTTDTPGARDAGVPRFIDIFLKDCASAEERSLFRCGLG